jgi:hypothetical protein
MSPGLAVDRRDEVERPAVAERLVDQERLDLERLDLRLVEPGARTLDGRLVARVDGDVRRPAQDVLDRLVDPAAAIARRRVAGEQVRDGCLAAPVVAVVDQALGVLERRQRDLLELPAGELRLVQDARDGRHARPRAPRR